MSPHGTCSRYVNDRCRCQPCRDAQAAYRRGYIRRPYPEELLRHGEPSTYYNHRCRCEACTKAASAQRRRARMRSGHDD